MLKAVADPVYNRPPFGHITASRFVPLLVFALHQNPCAEVDVRKFQISELLCTVPAQSEERVTPNASFPIGWTWPSLISKMWSSA